MLSKCKLTQLATLLLLVLLHEMSYLQVFLMWPFSCFLESIEVLRAWRTAMQFFGNTVLILTIAFLSFEFSFLLSRGLLSLMLHSMQRLESRVKSH